MEKVISLHIEQKSESLGRNDWTVYHVPDLHKFRRFFPLQEQNWLTEKISFIFVHRAIPEAGYITLGTIRYGVKLSHKHRLSNCSHSVTSSITTGADRFSITCSSQVSTINGTMGIEHELDALNNAKSTNLSMPVGDVSDSDHSLSDIASVNGSCCIDTTKIPLPWISKSDRAHAKSTHSNGKSNFQINKWPLRENVYLEREKEKEKKQEHLK